MQKTIYVLEGSYRNKLIENQTFQLVKPYQPHPHKEGGYITVKVNPEDYAGATSDKIKVHVANENQLRDSAPEQPKEESIQIWKNSIMWFANSGSDKKTLSWPDGLP